MLVVKLKDAMECYRRKTGKKVTYAKLADMTGIAHSTLRKIGSILGYHTTLANVEKICRVLNVAPGDLLELIDDPPEADEPKKTDKRKSKKSKTTKTKKKRKKTKKKAKAKKKKKATKSGKKKSKRKTKKK